MTAHRHSVAVIAIHWLSVVLLVLALAKGVGLDELPRGDRGDTAQLGHTGPRLSLLPLHCSPSKR